MTFPAPYQESYPPSLWGGEVAAVKSSPAGPAAPAVPDDSWLKVDIQEWLTEHEIAWDSSATKADLLELVAAATAPEPEPAAEPEAEGGEV